MYTVIRLLLVSSLLTGSSEAQELSVKERADLVRNIMDWRSYFLGDGVRWNWCRLPAFWGAEGQLIGADDKLSQRLQEMRRSDCQSVKDDHPLTSMVTVFRVTLNGDTLSVFTSVQRPGVLITDQYLLLRDLSGIGFNVREYRILGAMAGH